MSHSLNRQREPKHAQTSVRPVAGEPRLKELGDIERQRGTFDRTAADIAAAELNRRRGGELQTQTCHFTRGREQRDQRSKAVVAGCLKFLNRGRRALHRQV